MKRYSLNILVGVLLAGMVAGIACGYLIWAGRTVVGAGLTPDRGKGITALGGGGDIAKTGTTGAGGKANGNSKPYGNRQGNLLCILYIDMCFQCICISF